MPINLGEVEVIIDPPFTEVPTFVVRGPQGGTGPTGPAGDDGSTGPKGDTGNTGGTGPAGDDGPTGPKGDTGNTGSTGPTGAGFTTPTAATYQLQGFTVQTPDANGSLLFNTYMTSGLTQNPNRSISGIAAGTYVLYAKVDSNETPASGLNRIYVDGALGIVSSAQTAFGIVSLMEWLIPNTVLMHPGGDLGALRVSTLDATDIYACEMQLFRVV